MSTFIATDGREYQSDTWYPLPFIVGNKSMLPVDPNQAHLLRLLRKSGEEDYWHPFICVASPATHWKLQLLGHYEI